MNSRSPRRMKSEQTNLLSSPQDRPQDEERGLYAVSAPSPRDEGVAVQKGQSRIAQRFNAGLDAKSPRVPKGRPRSNFTPHPSAVPSGLVCHAGFRFARALGSAAPFNRPARVAVGNNHSRDSLRRFDEQRPFDCLELPQRSPANWASPRSG